MQKNLAPLLASASAAVMIMSAGVASAQSAGVAPAQSAAVAPDQKVGEIAEIIVTANRRTENAQKVAVAIASMSGDIAKVRGVTDMQSLANAVTGLRVDRGLGTAVPFLRGVGSPTPTAGIEPSGAFYIDDVYTPSGGAVLGNFNSVANLEVDKGPHSQRKNREQS